MLIDSKCMFLSCHVRLLESRYSYLEIAPIDKRRQIVICLVLPYQETKVFKEEVNDDVNQEAKKM